MAKTKVMIVEDEEALSTLLDYNLRKEGFKTTVAADGDEALLKIEDSHPDLIVLDWMLPNTSGIEICRRLRSKPDTQNIPIIMLTARSEESDRIRGLETGADDYLTKPFSTDELIARIRAVLRRIRPGLVQDEAVHGDIRMDRTAHRVWREGKEIHLGPTEFRLLDHLIEHPGRVFSREQLLNAGVGIGRLRRSAHGRCAYRSFA